MQFPFLSLIVISKETALVLLLIVLYLYLIDFMCACFRVKTSELFERWRNLQVCKWEQNKEETDNFK